MYFLKKTNHPFPTYWRQGISPAQILGLPSWIVTRNYVLAWTKAAPPASFAVTAAERWCYPARTLLPSPLTHTPRPSPQAPATSFSLICFQHTAFNERRPPSVPAAHASSTSAARPHRHAHTCPVSTPQLPPRERGNPKHRTSPLLLLFCNSVVFPIKYLQTHTHTHKLCTQQSLARGSYATAYLHCAMSAPQSCCWHKPREQCRGEVTSS